MTNSTVKNLQKTVLKSKGKILQFHQFLSIVCRLPCLSLSLTPLAFAYDPYKGTHSVFFGSIILTAENFQNFPKETTLSKSKTN